jgi:hypothetical protein
MTEQHPSAPRTGHVATPALDPLDEAFARMLETKVEQGYTIESREGHRAVLVTRGSSRWLGLGKRGASAREVVEIDADGKFMSRQHP